MIPVQIYLSPVQYTRLKDRSEQAQKSMSALIREALDAYLQEAEQPSFLLGEDSIFDLIGLIDTAPEDVSANHDAYLYKDPHK